MTPATPPREIRIAEDAEALARASAEEFRQAVASAVGGRGEAAVALSGGTTPRRLYELLAGEAHRNRLDWARIHFFFGDERHAPPEDPESNYRMAFESMFQRVPVPEGNVHRIRGEAPEAEAAARDYERDLRRHFRLRAGEFPRFDLALLGLGPDGHTASLFPGTRALREKRRLAVANWVGKLDTSRITLTAPVFNHSACVLFLVSGQDKAMPLKSVLEGAHEPEQLPAQLIRPGRGRLLWLADRAAAARLSGGAARSG
ncbi:MAG: 6-phosphogluconolactonase [Acidobacteriota bacterium]